MKHNYSPDHSEGAYQSQSFSANEFILGWFLWFFCLIATLTLVIGSNFAPVALFGSFSGLVLVVTLYIVVRITYKKQFGDTSAMPTAGPNSATPRIVAGSVLGPTLVGLAHLFFGEVSLLFIGTFGCTIGVTYSSGVIIDMHRHNRRLAQREPERWRPRRDSSDRWRS